MKYGSEVLYFIVKDKQVTDIVVVVPSITLKINIFMAIYFIDELVSEMLHLSNWRSSEGLLATPKGETKITLGNRSFTAAAPRLWNALPCGIQAIGDQYTFKQHLEMYLSINTYYEMGILWIFTIITIIIL